MQFKELTHKHRMIIINAVTDVFKRQKPITFQFKLETYKKLVDGFDDEVEMKVHVKYTK